MPFRTSDVAVKAILLDNYDAEKAYVLTAFIESANVLTNRVVAKDTAALLSVTDQEMIERYLAAHFYQHGDQGFSKRSEGTVAGTFHGKTEQGLSSTQYGQAAIGFDSTGELAAINAELINGKSRKARVIWAGT